MRKSKIRKRAFILCLLSITFGSCISRLSRPQITGTIVNYDKKPIKGCKVGEVLTDENGHFTLPERRYNAFLLTEIMVMEAPPLFVFEPIEKEGFESDVISMSNPFGGGKPKGAKSPIDTIFLKKKNQQFDLPKMLNNSNWKLAYTKNADTIYMIKDGFEEWCKTDRCGSFLMDYKVLTDNYFYSSAKNLPEGMIKRFIDVAFKKNNPKIEIIRIRQYNSTFDGPNIPPDTLNTSGVWKLKNDSLITLNIDKIKAISGEFKISDIDLYQLKLIKTK
ncbi:hypothetical protein EZJ43_07940 [Pedobacter changchengzhani]|uniref:Carboxypeptidase regulatory-like domain-containing protein n=1 Tax=Pedobacter changchengzhani TaxID=2529274 RepID=A0A4R5ML70_9SPHI|nr:hypothetical protein [Pedobacter changchengzhani]TDG36440.1 hypothetical protein EZJ43_07940 [Pedobacter changchengzhani]